jgi:hypothetical protein
MMHNASFLKEEPCFYYQWVNVEKRRYYTVHIVENLFREWVVIQNWGAFSRKGGGQKKVPCASLDIAQAMIVDIARRRRYRHYQRVQ